MNPSSLASPHAPAAHEGTPCPVCGNRALTEFFASADLPAQIGILWNTPEDARRAPRGDVRLAYCDVCTLIHNRAFNADLVTYQPGYEFSLHHSPAHRAFLIETADRLIDLHDLHGKAIVEVGCGEGYFLKLLCERAGARGFGFDPAVPEETTLTVGTGRVTFIRDYYSPKYAEIPCDLLCTRSMFDQVAQPLPFLRTLRETIGERKPAVYFDLPSGDFVFGQKATWNVFYEQCCYFDLTSIERAFTLAGFEVVGKGNCLGDGYYLYVDAVPSKTPLAFSEDSSPMPTLLAEFGQQHREEIERWSARFVAWRRQQRRVVAWGSGGRCINFLNALPSEGIISHVVDINPRRQGGYISGTGQEVISPHRIRDLQPEVIVISNPLYASEIREQVASLGVDCEFLEL